MKEQMWREYFVYTVSFLPLAAGNGTTAVFTDADIRIDPDSDFEFVSSMHTATSSNFRIQLRDDSLGRFLQKGHQHAETVLGKAFTTINSNAFLPFKWPAPYVISAATTLTVSVADFSTASNTIRIAYHGFKRRPGIAPWNKKYKQVAPYVYPITTSGSTTIAANSTTTAAIQTDREAAFQVMQLTGRSTGACTLTIKDSARDAQWMNSAVHFDNLVGNSQFPHILEAPRFVYPGSVLTVALTDLSGSSNTVELNFIGRKLYEG